MSYTYSDSTWKDLLMNYGGTSITYDEIGNAVGTIGVVSVAVADGGSHLSYMIGEKGIND